MGEMADLLDDQIFNEQNFMESHRYVGTRFKYKHTDGKTYHFKTQKEAQEWAKSKGFKLSTTPKASSKGSGE